MKRLLLIGGLVAGPALAQDAATPSRIVTIGAGVQAVPGFPGDAGYQAAPLIFARVRRPGEPIPARSPDQGPSIRLIGPANGLSVGPTIGFQGRRRNRDVGAEVGNVAFSVEPGMFVQGFVTPALRLRAELRHGVTGHRGVVGDVAADYVLRGADDRYVATVGPRARFGGARFNRSYFGVSNAAAAAIGAEPSTPDGGLHAAGVAAGLLFQLTPRWGLFAQAGIDRLTGDAARSAIVRRFGDRTQLNAGAAITYTFGVGRRRADATRAQPVE